MTGAELKTFTESLLDNSVSATFFYEILNFGKEYLEGKRDWAFLKACDQSQSANPGETYLTMKNFPVDFNRVLRIFIDNLEYYGVNFEERERYRASGRKYYLDIAQSQYALIGAPSEAKTVNFFYIKTTPDIGEATSPVFPARFHKILGFIAAGFIMNGVDADDVYRGMAPEQKQAAQMLMSAMEDWDDNIRLASMDHSAAPFVHESDRDGAINIYE